MVGVSKCRFLIVMFLLILYSLDRLWVWKIELVECFIICSLIFELFFK